MYIYCVAAKVLQLNINCSYLYISAVVRVHVHVHVDKLIMIKQYTHLNPPLATTNSAAAAAVLPHRHNNSTAAPTALASDLTSAVPTELALARAAPPNKISATTESAAIL